MIFIQIYSFSKDGLQISLEFIETEKPSSPRY